MSRLVFGVEGPELTDAERRLFASHVPLGFVLYARNLVSAEAAAALAAELRGLGTPPPLLFVDQEGGRVDRLGPLLGAGFPSATLCAAKGTDRVHECAFLMGRAARLLGFDVDLAPCLDLGQPGTGEIVLEGRTFGFHPEDVIAAGMVFLHGLARAGVASCVKHFPGIGRGPVDSHVGLPIVDAHDVDLMVTDVAPFTRLARVADGVMVGHAAFPGFTGDETPASLSPRLYRLLRENLGYGGLVLTDDLAMGALTGPIPERAVRATEAGADVLLVSKPFEAYEETIARVEALPVDPAFPARVETLRRKCGEAPRPAFTPTAWDALAAEVARFRETLDRPREKRPEPDLDLSAWE